MRLITEQEIELEEVEDMRQRMEIWEQPQFPYMMETEQ